MNELSAVQVAKDAVPLTVNGAARTYQGDGLRRLADVLRDDFKLTGTKIGCNAGDCGACTVLMDGEQICACLVPIGQCAGAAITTVEGLGDPGRLDELQRAFLNHGAAQCGVCTPGMLMAASDLLARNATPSRAEAEDALGGVLCRCTGYQKIVEAVLDVARPLPINRDGTVGARTAKVDGPAKLTGKEQYGADAIPADALHVRAIRSPHPYAKFTLGDLDAFVAARPGLMRALTSRDVPSNGYGIYPTIKDQPVLADGLARYRGDPVVAFVGTRAAIEAVRDDDVPVSYEPLPAIFGIEAAKAAAPIHPGKERNILIDGGVTCGDVESAFATAAHVAEVEYETSFVEHAYIEPEAGWAERKGDTLDVHVSTQNPFQHRDDLAQILKLPKQAVRLISSAVGGGFGGKLDLNVHPLVGLAAWLCDKPVAYIYTRPESMAASTKRHPALVKAKVGCDATGKLTGFWSQAELDTGAYASWGPTVANRVPVHAPGPYVVPHARTRGTAYFTNCPPSGAFRGFGVPQSAIASEAAMDQLADALGMDWLEFRRLNALRKDDVTITGQVLEDSVGIVETLDAVEPYWRDWNKDAAAFNQASARLKHGVGVACSWYGIGNTSLSNPSEMKVGIAPDGRITLYCGAVDIGQGSNTILTQIAADALGVPAPDINLVMGDTARTLDAGKTSASRQTFVTGKACELAALDLKAKLAQLRDRAALRDLPVDNHGDVLTGYGKFDPPTTPLDENGQGVPYACYGFATQVALVQVDLDLGTVKVLQIAAAHDVGKAVNPQQVEGQIHGGTAQGIGLALMEEYLPGRTENLHDYLIPTFGDMPEMICKIVEAPTRHGPHGAKGVGEPALISTAPAIFGGIYRAAGVRVTKVPVLPHRLRAAIRAKETMR
ncbi:MAG TPA: molybdopterin cofactor-binding domain-containing protein [Dongiaceae bacterium]|jgi:CO/xanthine dehydrogenase Mo-binding subunit/aerobic-type carbon monoxide dehydrogenase small subunit (CoxS/CutS family)|nr:molybdopterin cofactor-binding domain-containing protein [Dongiaceae bacterium]